MNTPNTKMSELLSLSNEETLQELEMVELKGGKIALGLTDNVECNTKLCGNGCPIIGNVKECLPPPIGNSIFICR